MEFSSNHHLNAFATAGSTALPLSRPLPSCENSGMNVILNGETLTLQDPCTIAELLDRQQLTQRRVAVERNGDIVPRSLHASTQLLDGDTIEIVHALGGG